MCQTAFNYDVSRFYIKVILPNVNYRSFDMALKLRKFGARISDIDNHQQASSSKEKDAKSDWYGRPVPPPAPGSSYLDFLDWAAFGAFEPSGDDIALAVTLWSGRVPNGKEEDVPSFKM